MRFDWLVSDIVRLVTIVEREPICFVISIIVTGVLPIYFLFMPIMFVVMEMFIYLTKICVIRKEISFVIMVISMSDWLTIYHYRISS
jgi:hypothetical protein